MSTHVTSAALSTSTGRAPKTGSSPARRRLSLVPRTRSGAPRVPFVLLVVTLLTAGLVGLLVLNTSMQRGAYVATSLREESARLDLRQQQLSLQVASLEAPRRVAERAIGLGMVQNNYPAFLSVADGSVIGKAVAGRGGDQVEIGTAPGFGVHNSKRSTLLAGASSSITTGPVKVPKPKPGPHAGDPTKPGDTQPDSQGRTPAQGTKRQQN